MQSAASAAARYTTANNLLLQHQQRTRPGRSQSSNTVSSPLSLPVTSKTSDTASAYGDESRAGANSAHSPRQKHIHPSITRSVTAPTYDSTMTSYGSSVTVPSPAKISPTHAKLHKRGGSGSGSSLPGPGNPITSTPFATQTEPFPDVLPAPVLSSTPKIKPYLRKISTPKDDQGRIDLSRSLAENERLAGLGIQDLSPISARDVPFAPPGRQTPHTRNTSVGSQMSTGSTSFKPTQPFIHPMRQAPRPYTPPTSHSNDSAVHDEEARESSDVVDDDFRLGHGFRTRRSTSISSSAQIAPTPLSQTITASDLGYVPKLTSPSQTNLSIKSNRSGKSSKRSRSRRNTGRSQDMATSPSSRTSLDKTFSFASLRVDSNEPGTRDERIRAARRKFEEKEAEKDRKAKKENVKRREAEIAKSTRRQERQRRKSEASEKSRHQRPSTASGDPPKLKKAISSHRLQARPYEHYSDSADTPLPIHLDGALLSEKHSRSHTTRENSAQGGWVSWMRSRMLSCGGRRR